MNVNEAASIAAIFVAANKLSNDYAKSGGAENRRDQIKAFLASAIDAAAALTAAYDDELTDPAYIQADKGSVCQSVDVAFYDAVEAEEKAEPRINVRQYSALRVVGGSVA